MEIGSRATSPVSENFRVPGRDEDRAVGGQRHHDRSTVGPGDDTRRIRFAARS